jgi:curved DNA-binding protein
VLSDPDKRRAYDTLRRQFGAGAYDRFRGSYSRADIFRDSDIHQVFETMANRFGFRGFDEVFKEFYGTGYKSFDFSQPGFFAKGFVFFGPLSGKRHPENFFPMTGRIGQAIRFLTKKASEGTLSEKSPDIHEVLHLSPEQADKGGPYAYFAEHRSKKLIVKIPPKVREGQQIRLTGMGKGSKEGKTPGDLYLQVKIKQPLLEKVKSFLSGRQQGK